jgi:anti-sigma B factor antagonist
METGSSAKRWWRGMKKGYFAEQPQNIRYLLVWSLVFR